MMRKFILLFVFIVMPLAAYAQGSIKVESSGVYTGPIQTVAPPIVVELFSSQNCPACPPADEYMGKISKMDGVIALSCHVDYFGKTSANLGRPICTQRQSRYIEQMGRRSHFTPQIMINGHMSEVGYDQNAVAASIVKARSEKIQKISISKRADSVYNFVLPSMAVSGKVEIWTSVYQKPQTLKERGRSVTYSNVLKNYISLGVWDGQELHRAISPVVDSKSAGFTIVAQEIESGRVLAAGNYPL